MSNLLNIHTMSSFDVLKYKDYKNFYNLIVSINPDSYVSISLYIIRISLVRLAIDYFMVYNYYSV